MIPAHSRLAYENIRLQQVVRATKGNEDRMGVQDQLVFRSYAPPRLWRLDGGAG